MVAQNFDELLAEAEAPEAAAGAIAAARLVINDPTVPQEARAYAKKILGMRPEELTRRLSEADYAESNPEGQAVAPGAADAGSSTTEEYNQDSVQADPQAFTENLIDKIFAGETPEVGTIVTLLPGLGDAGVQLVLQMQKQLSNMEISRLRERLDAEDFWLLPAFDGPDTTLIIGSPAGGKSRGPNYAYTFELKGRHLPTAPSSKWIGRSSAIRARKE